MILAPISSLGVLTPMFNVSREMGSWPGIIKSGRDNYPFVLSVPFRYSVLNIGQILLVHGAEDKVDLGVCRLPARRDY